MKITIVVLMRMSTQAAPGVKVNEPNSGAFDRIADLVSYREIWVVDD
jgi:hypothetical protein